MSRTNVAPRSSNRPNGLSIASYKGYEKWSYRRWAWEFLRRNEDFIAACDALDQQEPNRKETTQKKLAEKFHLQSFKDYRTSYKSDGNPAPKFSVRTIRKIVELTNPEPDGKAVKIRSGQVWLRFDLNHEFVVLGSLDCQLRVAKRSLNLALKEYAEITKKKLPAKKKPERTKLIDLLRRLDACAGSDVKWKGLAELYPQEFRDKASDERSKIAGSLIRAARLHAKQTYLTLAVHAAR